MHGIIHSSLQYRFLVIVIAVVLIVAGFNQIRSMPVDALPEFSPPYVEIQTEAPGLSAQVLGLLLSVLLAVIGFASIPFEEQLNTDDLGSFEKDMMFFLTWIADVHTFFTILPFGVMGMLQVFELLRSHIGEKRFSSRISVTNNLMHKQLLATTLVGSFFCCE